MRRAIASFLMVSLFVAGLEVAIDLEEAMANERTPLTNSQLLHDGTEGGSDSEADCDHCCHSLSHLTGMPIVANGIALVPTAPHIVYKPSALRSLRSPPPVYPPKV